jgi:formylglycine-generating enzyme required for sulfatase activity
LTDFGVAKQLSAPSLTSTGMVIGTLQYISPEQLKKSKHVTHLCDIYSVGVILYRMLAGYLPFQDEFPNIIYNIIDKTPDRPSGLSGGLWKILRCCLAKDPEERFVSCLDLKAALDAHLASEQPILPLGEYKQLVDSAHDNDADSANQDIKKPELQIPDGKVISSADSFQSESPVFQRETHSYDSLHQELVRSAITEQFRQPNPPSTSHTKPSTDQLHRHQRRRKRVFWVLAVVILFSIGVITSRWWSHDSLVEPDTSDGGDAQVSLQTATRPTIVLAANGDGGHGIEPSHHTEKATIADIEHLSLQTAPSFSHPTLPDQVHTPELTAQNGTLPEKGIIREHLAKDAHHVLYSLYQQVGDRPTFTISDVTFEARFIPAGSFHIGSSSSEQNIMIRDCIRAGVSKHQCYVWFRAEAPQKTVTLTYNYLIMVTEITQKQYQAVMGYNPSFFKACGLDCPVETVSWHEASAYANALSRKQNLEQCYVCGGVGAGLRCELDPKFTVGNLRNYHRCLGWRLPTEVEWEYAARSGAQTALYTGDIDIKGFSHSQSLDPIAWYTGNSGVSYRDGYDCSGWGETQYQASLCGTHPVGKKNANAWGLHDMLGNVLEWCWDVYQYSYLNLPAQDPLGPSEGTERTLRGGSWFHDARYVRAAQRFKRLSTYRSNYIGFRLVITLP